MIEDVLTIEILDKAISQLPPRKYPKRMRISPDAYRKLREGCAFFGVVPEIKEGITPWMGLEVMPDETLAKREWYFEWEAKDDTLQKG